jgi:hypothetical protein
LRRAEDDITVTTSDDVPEGDGLDARVGENPLAVEELVRAATRLVMGSAGIAVATAARWQRRPAGEGSGASTGAGNLASAALGLGLSAERMVVRGASAVGGTAASVTWSVVHASPLRRPVERLADRFRGEQGLSEQEVADAVAAILDAIGEAVLARVDLDRIIDRIALERVLARVDRRELVDRIRSVDLPVGD